jgi:hypothetical protein
VIERIDSDCKYVEIFPHRFGSTGALSRAVCVRGQTPSNEQSPRWLGGTRRLTFFQEGNAGFKAMIDMNKRKVNQGDVSVYVKNVNLTYLTQKYNYKEHEGNPDRNRRKLLLDALKLLVIGRLNRIPNFRGMFQLGPD